MPPSWAMCEIGIPTLATGVEERERERERERGVKKREENSR